MRRSGLFAGMILGTFLLALPLQAQSVSVFQRTSPEFAQKFGVSLNVGGSFFGTAGGFETVDGFNIGMSDINRSYQTYDQNGNLVNFHNTFATNALNFGIALTYRQFENWRWSFGYDYFSETSSEVRSTSSQDIKVHYVRGSELYVTGSYLIPWTDTMTWDITLGPTVVGAAMDREIGKNSSGIHIADASGRALGFRANVGLQMMLNEDSGLHFTVGYRSAFVSELTFVDGNGLDQVAQDGLNTDFAADYSSIMYEVAFVHYFKPATNWLNF